MITDKRLEPRALLAVLLVGLYNAAEALCSIFVSVYFWINSLDFQVVCKHYLAIYIVTPIVFLLSGWFATHFDRLKVYRLGLMLHVVYYACLLTLQEQSPKFAVPLGIIMGVTWGIFWAGANTFDFDVTRLGKRERYLGILQGTTDTFRLIAPMIGGLVIVFAPTELAGYHRVFAIAIGIFIICFILSIWMPRDDTRRPYKIKRALFPGKDQRDWRFIMAAAATLAGTFSIFSFLLGLLMYMETGDEVSVGGFASFQALAGIATALAMSRSIVPRTRLVYLRWGVGLLVLGGALLAFKLDLYTLIIFGFLRAVSGPLFSIPHTGIKLDTIAKSVEEPSQRIEYICAWEVPLAVGRILMMTIMMSLYGLMEDSSTALGLAVFALCSMRLVTYFLLRQTTAARGEV